MKTKSLFLMDWPVWPLGASSALYVTRGKRSKICFIGVWDAEKCSFGKLGWRRGWRATFGLRLIFGQRRTVCAVFRRHRQWSLLLGIGFQEKYNAALSGTPCCPSRSLTGNNCSIVQLFGERHYLSRQPLPPASITQ